MTAAETNRQIALEWIDAFNKHDLEKLLDLYNENAKHYSPKLKIRFPETNGLLTGKPSLRKWWADAFQHIPTLQYNLLNLIVNEHQLLMEYKRIVENEPDMMVAEILEIENGLIISSRVYHG